MKKIIILISVFLISIFCFLNINLENAKASSSSLYFNYTLKTTKVDYGYTNSESINNVKEVVVGEWNSRNFSIGINTSKNVSIGGYINSSNISINISVPIVISGNKTSRITNFILKKGSTQITNLSVTNITQSLSNEIFTGTLLDGNYTISVTWVNIDNSSSQDEKTEYQLVANTSFNIDTVSPTITYEKGDISLTGDIYSNTNNNITCSDSNLKSLFLISPTGSMTEYAAENGQAKTQIKSNGLNGLYKVYGVDLAGNKSNTVYYFLDTVDPIINFKIGSIYYENYINGKFTLELTETNIDSVYIKGGIYIDYEIFDETINLIDGKYYFKVIDKAGNFTEKSIILDTTSPTCNFTVNNNVCSKTKEDVTIISQDTNGIKNIYVKLKDDLEYTKVLNNSVIKTEGTYHMYAEDNAGNISSVKEVIIDKTPPVISTSASLNGTSNKDFNISIQDSLTSYIYLKKPNEEYQKILDKIVVIESFNEDGKYYFYGIDEVGNKSEEYYVNLQVPLPIADKYENNGKVKYVFSEDITGLLNGESYECEWIDIEGSYELVITSSSGRSNTYLFSISHNFVLKETISPSCSEKGYSVYKCSLCGKEELRDYSNTIPHDYIVTLVSKTCTIGTHYHYQCKNCEHNYDGEELDIPSHEYVDETVLPTCIERGYILHTCSICHKSIADNYVDKLGHDEVLKIISPTCEEDGYTHHYCTRCEYLDYTDSETEKLGHDYTDTIVSDTCTTNGYTKHVCTRCNHTVLDTEVLAKGHIYIEETIEVSCEEDGCIRHKCLRCEYLYTTDVVKKLGHLYQIEVTKEATCEEEGERYYLCTRCGEHHTEIINVKGHNYSLVDEYREGEEVIRKYRCKECGKEKLEEYSTEINGIAMLSSKIFERISPYIFPLYISFISIWSSIMGLMYIFAKREDELEKAKHILKNCIIGIIVISVIIVGGPYLLKGIGILLGEG